MRVVVLYRERSEHARQVEEFIHDFERWHPGTKLNVESLDTRDGAATASLYDISLRPAILALRDDGQLIQSWGGDRLPLMNDVAYYANL